MAAKPVGGAVEVFFTEGFIGLYSEGVAFVEVCRLEVVVKRKFEESCCVKFKPLAI